MADIQTPQSNGSIPSPAQLALAMAIVKQKPTDADIKGWPCLIIFPIHSMSNTVPDYILQIRSHISHAKNPHPVSLPNKFFDSVSFWQQAYEKSEAEQSKLLDRIYELEQRNTALLAKSQIGNVAEDEKPPESSKRKANPKNAGTATARKRAKTQGPGQGSVLSNLQEGNDGILDMIVYTEESELVCSLVFLHNAKFHSYGVVHETFLYAAEDLTEAPKPVEYCSSDCTTIQGSSGPIT